MLSEARPYAPTPYHINNYSQEASEQHILKSSLTIPCKMVLSEARPYAPTPSLVKIYIYEASQEKSRISTTKEHAAPLRAQTRWRAKGLRSKQEPWAGALVEIFGNRALVWHGKTQNQRGAQAHL